MWPGMRLGSAPGAAPGLLSSDTVSGHRTLGVSIQGDLHGRKINNTNPQTGRDSHCCCGKNH